MRRLLAWLKGDRIYSEIRPPIRPGDASPFTAGTTFLDEAAAAAPRGAAPSSSPPPAPPLRHLAVCPVADVAAVGAALSGSGVAGHGRVLPAAAPDTFGGGDAPREVRLRALVALRTRASAARRSNPPDPALPAWAGGRMPAARRPLTTSPATLPPDVAAVVDVATTPPPPRGEGAAFGVWESAQLLPVD